MVKQIVTMARTDAQRHRMIERAVGSVTPAHATVSMFLWEQLAAELNLIIGDRGFDALYWRSLSAARSQFPWLEARRGKDLADAFRLLADTLQTRTPAEAHAACAAMLNIFIDTLTILIGELVTNSILRAAWGDDVVKDAGTEHRA